MASGETCTRHPGRAREASPTSARECEVMAPDGQQKSEVSDTVTGQRSREPSQFATSTVSTEDQLTSHGDGWETSSFCTERERSTRWPLG